MERCAAAPSLVNFGISLSFGDCLELLAALVRHPTIVEVDISYNPPPHGQRKALGKALAELLAADKLQVLSFDGCFLGNRGMRPVLAALKRCSVLRELHCWQSGVTTRFARDVLLPAIQANKSLSALTLLTTTQPRHA